MDTKKTQMLDQDDNMQLSLQPKIRVLESEINHSWQYAIKPKDESISKYKKIKLVAKLKEITMLASKVPLEIRFACETLNHQDSKKFKNFANKANVMVWVLGLFY